MSAVSHVVDIPVFNGPIDLLLRVVSNHELDVLEIPMADVVNAFLVELPAIQESSDMDTISEFLLIAAILVELKSQRLLPGSEDPDADEDMVGFEERDLLLARLLECRAYAAAADVFVVMIEAAAASFPRESGLEDDFVVHAPDLLAGVTVDKLAQAYLRATAERPAPKVDLSHVTVDAVTVSETVQELVQRLPGLGEVSFRQLTQSLVKRIDVIVHFLAVLELCKLGKVSLGQGEVFGDLRVEWIGSDQRLDELAEGLALVEDYEG
jgi:segregation and condensation protein A